MRTGDYVMANAMYDMLVINVNIMHEHIRKMCDYFSVDRTFGHNMYAEIIAVFIQSGGKRRSAAGYITMPDSETMVRATERLNRGTLSSLIILQEYKIVREWVNLVEQLVDPNREQEEILVDAAVILLLFKHSRMP